MIGNSHELRCGMSSDTQKRAVLEGNIVTSRDELETYASEWNDLLSSSEANTVFLTWEWISAWLDAVYPDANLFTIAVRDANGQLIAVAPFYRSDFRLVGLVKYRVLRIIGDCQAGGEYGDVIIRRGCEDAVTTFLMQELNKCSDAWDCLWICNMAGWTNARERLRHASEEAGFYIHERVRAFSSVELPDTHEAYLSLLSKKRRGYLRRETRRLLASQAVELIRSESPDALTGHLEDLFELHRQRWESVGQAGSFVRRPLMKRFYEVFARESLRQGWLRLYVLKVDGIPQAAQYGYVYDSVYYALQEGYAPDGFEGIGNVLRNLVFEKCIEEGLSEYDFLGDFTPHKSLWCAKPREGSDLLIGRRTLRNHLLFWKNISPRGRFIQEGRPASEGRSHG